MRVGLVVVVVALAAALWLWIDRGDDVGIAPLSESPVVAEQPVPAAPPPANVPVPARTEVAASTTADVVEFVYSVRLVQAGDRSPVPGGTLSWLPADFDYGQLADEDRTLMQSDHAAFVAKVGRSMTADDQGRVSIPGPVQGLSLVASSGELFGQAWISALTYRRDGPPQTVAPDQEFTVELRRDRTLILRAIDSAGHPVVGAQIEMLQGNSRSVLGPTDADGLFRLRHIQQSAVEGSGPAKLRATVFGGKGDEVAVDLAAPPEQPVDVVFPPFGSIEVVLLDPDGVPWRSPDTNAIGIELKPTTAPDLHVDPHQQLVLGADATCVAQPVLCGLDFRLRAWIAFDVQQTFAGPVRAGQRVRAELRLPADTPILVGRLVDAERQPLATAVRLEYAYGGGSGTFQLTTPADGRWRVPLPRRAIEQNVGLTFTRATDPFRATEEQAHVTLPAPLSSGTTDVGDIVVAKAAVLVAGRVQWKNGEPVEPPPIQLEYAEDEQRGFWRQLHNVRPDHPGDGRFVVRGARQYPSYRIRVYGDFVPLEPVSFGPGTENLVIEVEKGGSVTARFTVDDATPWEQLQYRLDAPTPPADPRDMLARMSSEFRGAGRPTPDGEAVACRWTGLAPGEHRLTVTSPGAALPIVDLRVVVPRGAEAVDPRLNGIDLRGRVRGFTVAVVDAAGAPVVGGREAGVLIRGPTDPDATWHGQTLSNADGKVSLTATAPVDLVVFAPGYVTREVTGVFGDAEVRLDAATEVGVHVRLPLALPADATASLVCGPLQKPDVRSPRYRLESGGASSSGTIDRLYGGRQETRLLPDGTAKLLLTSGGPVRLWVVLRAASRRRPSATVEVQPDTIEPGTWQSGQVIELRVDEPAWQAAIAELGGK